MDESNLVIRLCIAGTQAEFAGKTAEAHTFYFQAWELAQNDYEACIAAHYVARSQTNTREVLWWNRESLARAQRIAQSEAKNETHSRVEAFFPSLYLNMGRAYELAGDAIQARRYYELAARLGYAHQPD